MSRALIAYSHNEALLNSIASSVNKLNRFLTPDNIEPNDPVLHRNSSILLAAFNPSKCMKIESGGICLGSMFEDDKGWSRPGARIPDGSFSLFRSNGDVIELVSDITGSRTIWYVQTDDLFLASSSQRAIISILGTFEPDHLAFTWFISSGCLGPELSWDKRIKALPSNSRLTFDCLSGEVSIVTQAVCFSPSLRPEKEAESEMLETLGSIFESFDLENERWVVPLSGGYDSRAILMFLKDRSKVEAVTWGMSALLDDVEGDSYVARRVAKELEVKHSFLPLDSADISIEKNVERFLVAGEGRVDHLSGYLDGFAVWKHLFDTGVDGTLRGDVCWPHVGVSPLTPFCVRQNPSIQLLLISDYSNLPECEELGLPEQQLPEKYMPSENEDLVDYGERIYQEFRMPLVLAALNDLKTAYVEIANPFLSEKLVRLIRRLPSSLRLNKKIFLQIVEKYGPDLPFAKRSSIATAGTFTRLPEFRSFMFSELRSEYARSLLPTVLLDMAIDGFDKDVMGGKKYKRKPAGCVRRMVRRLRAAIDGPQPRKPPVMTPEVLALRCMIISRMCRMFSEDAGFIKQ